MSWLAVVKRSINVPALELSVACFESFFGRWVSVVIVASTCGCETFDTIMIVTLVSFANKSNIGCCGDTMHISFLNLVNGPQIESGMMRSNIQQASLQSSGTLSLCRGHGLGELWDPFLKSFPSASRGPGHVDP